MESIKYNPVPVNIVAVRTVFYKGEQYISNKKIQTKESSLPIETFNKYELNKCIENLTGFKIGRLKVIGKAKNHKGWVVKCTCGKYAIRQAKAIKNKNNSQDRCEQCRQLAYIKRHEHFKTTGKDKDINEY